jgi:hypothetical protein
MRSPTGWNSCPEPPCHTRYSPNCLEVDFSHLGAPQSASANEEVELQACPKGTPRKVELEASESGPFRSTASLVLPREEQSVGA